MDIAVSSEVPNNSCQDQYSSGDNGTMKKTGANYIATDDMLHSATEEIRDSIKQILDDVNMKRKRDSQLLEELREDLEMWAQETYQKAKMSLYSMYKQRGKEVEEKLNEIEEYLAGIESCNGDLEQFRHNLNSFYQEIQGDSSF